MVDDVQDAKVTVKLLRIAESVPRLAQQAEDLLRSPATPGSRAAADIEQAPRRDDLPAIGLEPRLLASDQIASALDHLRAWQVILAAGQQPTGAHMTLLRSALLAAAVSRWLVDPKTASRTRLERAVAWLREDYRLRAQVERIARVRGGSSWRPAAERSRDLERAAADLELAAIPVLNDTDMVKHNGPHRRKDGNEVAFAVASAYAHSRRWRVLLDEADVRGDAPSGGLLVRTSANDQQALVFAELAFEAVALALRDLGAYLGA